MIVLAQIFDIMLPDKQTLLAEVKGDKDGLIKIFEARHKRDIEKTSKTNDQKPTGEEG